MARQERLLFTFYVLREFGTMNRRDESLKNSSNIFIPAEPIAEIFSAVPVEAGDDPIFNVLQLFT